MPISAMPTKTMPIMTYCKGFSFSFRKMREKITEKMLYTATRGAVTTAFDDIAYT